MEEGGGRIAHVNRKKQVPSTEEEIDVWKNSQGQ